MQKSVNRSLFIVLILISGINCPAQTSRFEQDIESINKMSSQIPPDPYRRPYIYHDEPSILKKINPVNIFFGSALYVYQNVLSKHISADCLFTPSCSEFSKQAIREFGLLKGIVLSVDRVNKCNRIAGLDLKHYDVDIKTNRYPDPVSRYKKAYFHNDR
jgi:uncharacterized protein